MTKVLRKGQGKKHYTQHEMDNALSRLVMELQVAGAEVLRDEFGFSQEQVSEWVEKVLARAEANRETNQEK